MTQSIPSLFHPLVSRWFADALGTPTLTQDRAWLAIAGGGHVLLTAPTGSGKTLAAFLSCLDRMVHAPAPDRPGPRLLYVSPIKALAYDYPQFKLVSGADYYASLKAQADAAFSAISGTALLLGAIPVASLMGLPSWIVASVGASLLAFADSTNDSKRTDSGRSSCYA